MNYLFWLGQIFGIFALVTLALSFKEDRKEELLKYQIFSNSFCALQYLCLGRSAYTGVLLHFLCLVRNFIYYKYDNKNIPFKWFLVCAISMVIVSFVSYESLWSLVPMIGIVLNSWGLWQSKLPVTRKCEAVAAFLVVVYNIKVLAWGGVLANGFEFVMVVIAIVRFDILKGRSLDEKH